MTAVGPCCRAIKASAGGVSVINQYGHAMREIIRGVVTFVFPVNSMVHRQIADTGNSVLIHISAISCDDHDVKRRA